MDVYIENWVICTRCGGYVNEWPFEGANKCRCNHFLNNNIRLVPKTEKKDLIESAANSAAQILHSAFVACELSDRIRATYDDEKGNRYLISFEKIETS